MSCFQSWRFYHCLQKSLSSSMSEPEFMMTDFAKFDRPGQLHLGFQAIYAFQKKHSRLPTPWSQVKRHCFFSCKCLAWYWKVCAWMIFSLKIIQVCKCEKSSVCGFQSVLQWRFSHANTDVPGRFCMSALVQVSSTHLLTLTFSVCAEE